MLLALSPLLNRGIDSLSMGLYRKMIAFLIFIEFVGGTIFHANGTTFMQLFLLYLMGRYMRIHGVKVLVNNATLLFFSSSLINMIIVFICSYLNIGGDSIIKLVESNRNPLILIAAISLFYMFKNRNKEIIMLSYISKLAPYMFSVYICHVYILYIGIIDFKECIFVSPFVSLFVCSFVTLFTCIVVDKFRMILLGKPIKKVSDFINNKFQFT